MFPRELSLARRVVPVLFGAALLFNHFHCVAYAAQAAGECVDRVTHENRGEELIDQGLAPRCKNESGCICRGATLIVASPLPTLDLTECQSVCVVAMLVDASSPACNLCELEAQSELRARSVPIAGRILRAHLASFLI